MGARTRKARRHSRTHIIGFGFAGVLGFIALLAIALAISAGALVNSWLLNLPDYEATDAYLVAEPTQVFDADNNVIAEYYLQNRRVVNKDEVSPYVLMGTVDTEDIRFYQHNGIDPQGIARAVIVQFTGGSEGASTITQQLVRNTVLSDEQFEQTLKRKVREAYIAIQMEKKYSKDQILMMYINTIYYGHAAYGIQAASITYFNKDAKNLTLAEAALLAGLPQSPSYFDPTKNPEAAIQRRNLVLERMFTAGDITEDEKNAAQAEPLTLNEGQVMEEQGVYPYFTDYVKQLLLQQFDQSYVFQGGLKVYTTIEPTSQARAEAAVQGRLEEYGNDQLEAALVCIEPDTGNIIAMVGGRDYNTDQFNLATQANRQPGSSFKAITLAAAMSEGMNPGILINCDSPIQALPQWKVQNYGNVSYGTLSLQDATAVSSNTGYVQVAQAIGADKIVEFATKMGISADRLEPNPSITLGSYGVPPVEMAEAYATLATGGIHRDSVAILRIEDRNGNVVYEHSNAEERVLDAAIAQAETEVLKTVITSSQGTANAMQNMLTIDQPVAGKTGTTEEYRDLWFCGYTPQLSIAIWCGYRTDEPVYINRAVAHPDGTACPIFASFVNAMLENTDRMEFPTTNEEPNYKENSEWEFSNTDRSISSQENGVSDPYGYNNNDWNSWNTWNNWNYYDYDYGYGYGYDDSDYGSSSGSSSGSGSGSGSGSSSSYDSYDDYDSYGGYGSTY